jgi:UDP-N-acetyl-2-amino-2-deoxyglucuronate dehydrogenase
MDRLRSLQMESRMPVKFAIVGCGAIGMRHAAVLTANPQAELVGVFDIDAGKMTTVRERSGRHVVAYEGEEQLLASPDVKVVSICTPHALHAPMAIRAAAAGKHVLVEKPMALTVADANSMVHAAERHGVHLMVVKQNRFNVPVRLTKQAIDEGKLGRVFMVQCNVLWNRHDGYYAESPWRGRREGEGGALYTQASHFVDLLNWWFGPVRDVGANTATRNHSISIEDCGTAVLHFESGVLGTLAWTTCVHNKNFEGSITIIAEHGTIKIGGLYLNKIEYWDVRAFPLDETISFSDTPNAYGRYQGSSSNHDKVIANVIARLSGEPYELVDGIEGITCIDTIQKVYAHARTL